jgi:hypothetical protein
MGFLSAAFMNKIAPISTSTSMGNPDEKIV